MDKFELLSRQAARDPDPPPDITATYPNWRDVADWRPARAESKQHRPFPAAREVPSRPFDVHTALSAGDIVAAQDADPDVRAMKAMLHDNNHQHLRKQQVAYARGCIVKRTADDQEMLCKTSTPDLGPQAGVTKMVPVLPAHLLPRAIAFAHDLTGHHGQSATIWQCLQHFHAFNLRTHARHYVASCDTCQRADATMRDAPYGHMLATAFLGRIGIAFVGHFSQDASGHTDICIIVDSCTKWVVAVPTHGQRAEDAVTGVVEFVIKTGSFPLAIHSDRGKAFVSEVFESMCKNFGIKQSTTAAYNPRGNGNTEAQVKNVVRIVRKALGGRSEQWAQVARWAAFAYNTSYNFTGGCSPFFARHGRIPRSTTSMLFPDPEHPEPSLMELFGRIQGIESSIRKSLDALEQSYTGHNAALQGVRSFTVGDHVFLRRVYPAAPANPGIDKKFFLPHWPHKFLVTEEISDQHYRIRRADNAQAKEDVVHVRRLKPFVRRALHEL